jgi:hypothetical protein
MGSSRVTLRGESILDFNSPGALIVVDGEPINTSFQGVGHGAYLGGDSPIDFGSALTDIDPNNIESINVLKGCCICLVRLSCRKWSHYYHDQKRK